MAPSETHSDRNYLRTALVVLLLVGGAGLLAELFLLDHLEDWRQWLPVIALGVGCVLAIVVLIRPGRTAWRSLLVTGVVFVLLGGVGIFFHTSGNREFELEMYPDLTGGKLLVETVTGATPVLAPGALVQLGLLAIIIGWPWLWSQHRNQSNKPG